MAERFCELESGCGGDRILVGIWVREPIEALRDPAWLGVAWRGVACRILDARPGRDRNLVRRNGARPLGSGVGRRSRGCAASGELGWRRPDGPPAATKRYTDEGSLTL